MAGCSAQRFSGVGVEAFACLQAKGAAAGVPISGAQGQATSRGVTMRWAYDSDAQVLVVECLGKPMLVPCGMVSKAISDLVEGCLVREV